MCSGSNKHLMTERWDYWSLVAVDWNAYSCLPPRLWGSSTHAWRSSLSPGSSSSGILSGQRQSSARVCVCVCADVSRLLLLLLCVQCWIKTHRPVCSVAPEPRSAPRGASWEEPPSAGRTAARPAQVGGGAAARREPVAESARATTQHTEKIHPTCIHLSGPGFTGRIYVLNNIYYVILMQILNLDAD